MPGSLFRPLGPSHLGVLIFIVMAILLLVVCSKSIRRLKDDQWFRRTYAFLLLAAGINSWIYFSARSGEMSLPLQLCDLALFLMVWALLEGNRTVRELAFFWGLAGSSQAMLTPDLIRGFPSFDWFSFFLNHSAVVLGAVYLAARGLLALSPASIGRVFLFSNLYVGVIGFVNWQGGTNYGYLARKPESPSLLDYLGPWPYYIFWCEFIGLALLFLCFGFSRMVDRLARIERISDL